MALRDHVPPILLSSSSHALSHALDSLPGSVPLLAYEIYTRQAGAEADADAPKAANS